MSELDHLQHIPSFQRAITKDTESHDGREADFVSFINARTANDPKPIPVKKLLELTDEFSYHNDFLISIGYQKAEIFANEIRKKKPKTFVELGGYLAYSALLAADVMREYAPDAHVWSVEMDKTCADYMTEIISLAGLEHAITVVNASSTDAITKMQAQGAFKNVDMLFLDHDEARYLEDLNVYLEKGVIGTGSLVAADNVIRPGAPDYLAHVRKQAGLDSHGIKCFITPGKFEDEIEFTHVVNATKALQ